MPDFDDILREIGDFGRFQIINYLLLCIPIFFNGANTYSHVFTAGAPNYRCFIDGCDSDTSPEFAESWVSAAIPPSSKDGPYVPDQCLQYIPQANFSQGICQVGQFEVKTTKCDRWVFEDNERTIVGDFNITCAGNQWKLALVQTVPFVGILIGSPIFGVLADKFGRKTILVFCIVIMSLSGIAEAMSRDYIFFQLFLFLRRILTSGVYPSAFILAVELVGSRKREMVGAIINLVDSVSVATLGLIAWLSKDRVVTQLVLSIPPTICVVYYWIIPELVRWLLANKQKGKASVIIQRAAAVNGAILPIEMLSLVEDPDNVAEISPILQHGVWASVKQLLQSRVLCVRSLLLCYIWVANSFTFYGLSLHSTSLSGNKYFNFILVGLVEIPGYTLSWWTMNKLGRRRSVIGCMLLCGVTCATAALVPDGITWTVVLLYLLGKFGITASFGVAFTYTAELYPTVVRSAGIAFCSTFARIGGVAASFAPLLGQYSKSLPLFLFSGVSLLAAVFALWLPETLGKKLPDTVAEASAF